MVLIPIQYQSPQIGIGADLMKDQLLSLHCQGTDADTVVDFHMRRHLHIDLRSVALELLEMI